VVVVETQRPGEDISDAAGPGSPLGLKHHPCPEKDHQERKAESGRIGARNLAIHYGILQKGKEGGCHESGGFTEPVAAYPVNEPYRYQPAKDKREFYRCFVRPGDFDPVKEKNLNSCRMSVDHYPFFYQFRKRGEPGSDQGTEFIVGKGDIR